MADVNDGTFEHWLVSPPEGEIPPAFTITYLEDRPAGQRRVPNIGERLGAPSIGHVIICADCRTEFGSLDVADNHRRFNDHECQP
jgi:hypothetical protein